MTSGESHNNERAWYGSAGQSHDELLHAMTQLLVKKPGQALNPNSVFTGVVIVLVVCVLVDTGGVVTAVQVLWGAPWGSVVPDYCYRWQQCVFVFPQMQGRKTISSGVHCSAKCAFEFHKQRRLDPIACILCNL